MHQLVLETGDKGELLPESDVAIFHIFADSSDVRTTLLDGRVYWVFVSSEGQRAYHELYAINVERLDEISTVEFVSVFAVLCRSISYPDGPK